MICVQLTGATTTTSSSPAVAAEPTARQLPVGLKVSMTFRSSSLVTVVERRVLVRPGLNVTWSQPVQEMAVTAEECAGATATSTDVPTAIAGTAIHDMSLFLPMGTS